LVNCPTRCMSWWITRGHHPANKSHHAVDTSIRTVSVMRVFCEVKNSENSDCSLLMLWKNNRSSLAGEMLQNHLQTATTSPSVRKKKLIPIYLQAHRLVNTRGYCVLPGREALWENHHLSRVRCGFHCDVRQPVLLIARAYDFIQENKTPHMCSCEPTRASASVSEANFSLKHKAKRVHLI